MAKDKQSFLLYTDIIHLVEKLTDDHAGKLFKHLLRYVNDLNPESDDYIVDLAFEPIKQSLKRDLRKYEEIREKRSKAGKESAKKRQQMSTCVECDEQTSTNPTVSVNDSVSVSVNVNDSDIINKEKNKNNLEYPQIKSQMLSPSQWMDTICMNEKVSQKQFMKALNDFFIIIENASEQDDRDMKEIKSYFARWFRKNKHEYVEIKEKYRSDQKQSAGITTYTLPNEIKSAWNDVYFGLKNQFDPDVWKFLNTISPLHYDEMTQNLYVRITGKKAGEYFKANEKQITDQIREFVDFNKLILKIQ